MLGLAVAGLAGWELASRTGAVEGTLFPPPSLISATLVRLVVEGGLIVDLGATLRRVLLGGVLGCVPAGVIGIAMGWSGRLRALLDPVVAALHPLPKIAILPLVMVVLGIGEVSKVAVVAVAAFFPMLINAMAGVTQIDDQLFEVVRSYGASRRKVLTRVVLPGSLPLVLTGLRIALNVALLLTIAVELVSARTGLGTRIWLAWETMRTEEVYAGLLVIGSLGVAVNRLIGSLTEWLTPWQAGAARRRHRPPDRRAAA